MSRTWTIVMMLAALIVGGSVVGLATGLDRRHRPAPSSSVPGRDRAEWVTGVTDIGKVE